MKCPDEAIPSAYLNRGNAYGNLQQYERTIDDYNKAIELYLNSSVVYGNCGSLYHALDKTGEAEVDFKKYEELTGEKP